MGQVVWFGDATLVCIHTEIQMWSISR